MYRNSLRSGRRLIHVEGEDDRVHDNDTHHDEKEGDCDKQNERACDSVIGDKVLSPNDEEKFCIETYLNEIRVTEKNVQHSKADEAAISSSDMTNAHNKRCQAVEVAFVVILSSIGKVHLKSR